MICFELNDPSMERCKGAFIRPWTLWFYSFPGSSRSNPKSNPVKPFRRRFQTGHLSDYILKGKEKIGEKGGREGKGREGKGREGRVEEWRGPEVWWRRLSIMLWREKGTGKTI